MRACVNTFKHEYLRNQWANRKQILSEASNGGGGGEGGKAELCFGLDRIGTPVSMPTDSYHKVIMEEPKISSFLKP